MVGGIGVQWSRVGALHTECCCCGVGAKPHQEGGELDLLVVLEGIGKVPFVHPCPVPLWAAEGCPLVQQLLRAADASEPGVCHWGGLVHGGGARLV